jgi:L-lactate dehydrogenase complex protein LldE
MKVALFIPCYIDQFLPDVGVATVKILKKFDLKIDYPLEQTCCGQPAFNSGYWSEAKALAEKIFENFPKL